MLDLALLAILDNPVPVPNMKRASCGVQPEPKRRKASYDTYKKWVSELDKSFQIICGRSNFGLVQPNFEVVGHLSDHLKKLFRVIKSNHTAFL